MEKVARLHLMKLYICLFLSLAFSCNSANKVRRIELTYNKELKIYEKKIYFWNSNVVKEKSQYLDSLATIRHGARFFYYQNGEINVKHSYLKDLPFGEQLEYYPNGKIKTYFFALNDSQNNCRIDFDSSGLITNREGNVLYWVYRKDSIRLNESIQGLIYLTFPEPFFWVRIIGSSDTVQYSHKNVEIKNTEWGRYIPIEIGAEKFGENNVQFIVEIDNKTHNADTLNFNYYVLRR